MESFILLECFRIFEYYMKARRKKDAPDIGENPFLATFKNKVSVISKTVNLSQLDKAKIEESKVTELMGDAVFYKKNNIYERDEFWIEYGTHDGIKLFDIKLKLTANARLLYDYIKEEIKRNKTCVYIDKVKFMQLAGITSQTTYIATKAALIKANIIAPSSSVYYGWYWVNPIFFFKGFRSDILSDYNEVDYIDLQEMAAAREAKKNKTK